MYLGLMMSMKAMHFCKCFFVLSLIFLKEFNRYLVLEHVSGGELFDYLVKKGRLSEREVRDSTNIVCH